MNAAQIELRGIERVFRLGDSEVHALRHRDVVIAPGEYVAVMGPSGSGKSTLLNLLDWPAPSRTTVWKTAPVIVLISYRAARASASPSPAPPAKR